MQCLLEGEGEADAEDRDPESSRRVRNRGNPILAMADILVFGCWGKCKKTLSVPMKIQDLHYRERMNSESQP